MIYETRCQQRLTADKRQIKDFQSSPIGELLLSVKRYMKWRFSPF
jgi:hypothetical protein